MDRVNRITTNDIITIIESKTLSKVYSGIFKYKRNNQFTIVYNTKEHSFFINNPVVKLTKVCGYKNKSTVSRALKELSYLDVIDITNKGKQIKVYF